MKIEPRTDDNELVTKGYLREFVAGELSIFRAEIKQDFRNLGAQFEVLQDNFQIIVEMIKAMSDKLDNKVDRDEYTGLEGRVAALEAANP